VRESRRAHDDAEHKNGEDCRNRGRDRAPLEHHLDATLWSAGAGRLRGERLAAMDGGQRAPGGPISA
jgi:hypothetical protein